MTEQHAVSVVEAQTANETRIVNMADALDQYVPVEVPGYDLMVVAPRGGDASTNVTVEFTDTDHGAVPVADNGIDYAHHIPGQDHNRVVWENYEQGALSFEQAVRQTVFTRAMWAAAIRSGNPNLANALRATVDDYEDPAAREALRELINRIDG